MTLINEHITPIPDTDPDAIPSLWNTRYDEIDENFEGLDGRTEVIETDISNAKGAEATLAAKVAAIVSEVSGIDGRLNDIELDSAVAVSSAVRLDWLYRQLRMALELWTSNWTQLDAIDLAITQTVAGDDSVDVDDTSELVVGQEYVIDDGTNHESVVVAEVLSATRFTATANLAHSFASGSLTRTNFTVTAGSASADAGQVYYWGPLFLGADDIDKAVIIRRQNNDTVLRLYFRDDTHAAWTEAHWEWQRDIETGVVDVEYRVPARGTDIQLKMVCEAGETTSTVAISHVVSVHADTGLDGAHHAPEKPVNDAPANSATGVIETPTITAAAYESLVGSEFWAVQLQISATSGDFSAPIYDSGASQPASLGITVPISTLAVSTPYYWRMRHQDIEGAWSEWSDQTVFTTASSYQYVVTPINQSPYAGAVDTPENPTLGASAFSLRDFPRISLSDGATNNWTDSPATAGEYYYGGSGGPTNKPVRVYANDILLAEGTLGSLANGEWAWGDQDTLGSDTIYVKLSIGDPDGQAADYVECGDSHVASQWQIRNAGEDYSSPVYDSGADGANLESIIIPEGNLLDGERDYYWRVRYQAEDTGWSEWSSESRFTTLDSFASIIGIALVTSGGGAGTWQRVDENGNNVTPDAAFFNNHPIYGNMDAVTIDGQAMVTVPKTYVKIGNAPAGSDQAGKKCWWVADAPVSGFALHTAFYDDGDAIDQFYFGAYEASDGGSSKAASVSGVSPLVDIDFPTMQTRCANRNTGGVSGFGMVDIHQIGIIQMLCLIENGGPDVQATIGAGNTASSAAVNTGASNAVWRGIHELWGNVWCMTAGLKTNTSNQIQVWDKSQTYVNTGFGVPASGWCTAMKENADDDYDLRELFIALTVSGTEGNGTFADLFYPYTSGSEYICCHGGDWGYGSNAGLFALNLRRDASSARSAIGSRLAKK